MARESDDVAAGWGEQWRRWLGLSGRRGERDGETGTKGANEKRASRLPHHIPAWSQPPSTMQAARTGKDVKALGSGQDLRAVARDIYCRRARDWTHRPHPHTHSLTDAAHPAGTPQVSENRSNGRSNRRCEPDGINHATGGGDSIRRPTSSHRSIGRPGTHQANRSDGRNALIAVSTRSPLRLIFLDEWITTSYSCAAPRCAL